MLHLNQLDFLGDCVGHFSLAFPSVRTCLLWARQTYWLLLQSELLWPLNHKESSFLFFMFTKMHVQNILEQVISSEYFFKIDPSTVTLPPSSCQSAESLPLIIVNTDTGLTLPLKWKCFERRESKTYKETRIQSQHWSFLIHISIETPWTMWILYKKKSHIFLA